jgi:hypothetical protein
MPFHHEPILAGTAGVEPAPRDRQSRRLPLSTSPSRWSERRDSNSHCAGFEPVASCHWATLGWCPPLSCGPEDWIRTSTFAVLGRATPAIGLPRDGARDEIRTHVGASGWTRTTASSVKGRACCIDTTEAWFGLRVSIPSLHAGNVGCSLHTQAEHGPVLLTDPSTSVSCQRPRSCERIRSYRACGDSARIRTWTYGFWRLGCFRLHHAVDVLTRLDSFEDTTSLRPDPYFPRAGPKQKRPSRGSP